MTRCSFCGTVQAEYLPSTEELQDFYSRQYLDDYKAGMDEKKFLKEMPLRHRAKLKLVSRLANPQTLLDVGCGEGMFLDEAVKIGIDAIGCDYTLRSEYPSGVTVHAGKVDHRLPFPDCSFDVVTLWAVIEHVRNPAVAASEIYRVLKPGGFTFWDTPLCGDWCELLVAGRSHWLAPPEHLHVFSQFSLRLLAREAGFVVIDQSPFFERNTGRWLARRLRNLAVGLGHGGATKLIAPAVWETKRQSCTTQIGDIQLLAAKKPTTDGRDRHERSAHSCVVSQL